MKTKKMLVLGIFLAGVLSLLSFQNGVNDQTLELGNIEVLSLGESSTYRCLGVGTLDCPIDRSKVRIFTY
jgi:hypothetical protein